MAYLASEVITRSRGNICEPSTTLAGATPFTRTFGANSTAISRIKMIDRRFARIVGQTAFFRDNGVRAANQDDAARSFPAPP